MKIGKYLVNQIIGTLNTRGFIPEAQLGQIHQRMTKYYPGSYPRTLYFSKTVTT